jgi:ATP-dependent Clp protease ATP-binding subunit ClpB
MPACRGEDTDGVSYRRGDRLNELKEEISQVKIDIEKAERDYELNTADELKYEKLPRLELESKRLEELANDEQSNNSEKMLRDEVVAEDIANVVAVWTGIPPQKLVETERERILTMADKLQERVVGQNEAIEVVTDAIQRSRAGLNDPSKPIASMMFLGPTGKCAFCRSTSLTLLRSTGLILTSACMCCSTQ